MLRHQFYKELKLISFLGLHLLKNIFLRTCVIF
jgi:hypothetical protein